MLKVETDSAGVRIPPPTALVAHFAATLLAYFTLPSEPLFSHYWSPVLGAFLMAAGIFNIVSCAIIFKNERTNIEPWRSTAMIVTSGAYRYSRNPIYASFIVMAVGFSCLTHQWMGLVLTVPLQLFLQFYVIRKEEIYLNKKFGEAYHLYQSSTRRWI